MGITANNRLLPAWLTRVETGQIKLPQFQRWEAWSHANVALLFNTVLHDLPAGSVLVLEIGNAEPFPSRVITGAPDATERTTEHLLDGQQRLTALWRGLNNNYEERTYFLVLTDDDDEETGLPYFVDSVSRGRRKTDNQRMPLWVDQPAQQWERRMIPLDMLAPGDASPGAFRSWSEQAIPDIQERMEITDTAYKVRNAFSTFNLPYLSLPVQTEPHTALDVFIRTNTSATPLGDYDIVVALVQAGTGQSLHDMVADTRQECPEISRYYSPEDLALAAGALLQGRTPGKSTYLSSGFGDQLVANWDRYSQGVKDAAEFLADEKIFDADRLPTDIVVPVLVAIWADAPTGPDAKGRARTILSKYAWRAFFTKRYERSTATRSLSDYNELRRHIHDTQAPLPSIFDDDANPLPEINELVEAGWPKRKDRLGRAILALAEFAPNSAIFGLPCLPSFGAKLLTLVPFGIVRIGEVCHCRIGPHALPPAAPLLDTGAGPADPGRHARRPALAVGPADVVPGPAPGQGRPRWTRATAPRAGGCLPVGVQGSARR